jgi:surface protein
LAFNQNGSLTSLPVGSFDTNNITTAGERTFGGFNQNGSLTSLPSGSFDTSNISSIYAGFFREFNGDGKITNLPDSFKRPSLDPDMDNFRNAFNSPLYTLNRNAANIINGGTTPNLNMATFSSNQPGLCDVDDNWKADPSAPCTPSLPGAVKPTDIQITAEITSSGQTVTINKYFTNTYSVNW